MKFNKKKYRFIKFIIIASILLFPSIIQANEIDLKEAIDWGIKHNYDLEEIRYNIETLERDLEILDAGKAFQVNLGITPIWDFGEGNSETSLLNLKAEKTIADDLNISAEISWNENDFADTSLEGIIEDVNASIKIEKQIYPDTYTQNEQQIFQTENNLKKKVEELTWKESEKQIDFIESYLTLVRLTEEVNLAEKNFQLATEELERVQQQIRLGEGGYRQETAAKLALMEAENQFFNLKQNLIQQQNEGYLELNLPEDIQIQFNEEPAYLQTLRSNIEQLTFESEKQETLFHQALEKHYQIKNDYIDKEALLKEAKWTENEGKPQINLSGGYDLSDDCWYAMLDLSWNLIDGGAQKLKEKGAEATILQKEKELDQLTKTLQLEMNQIINQDQYNQLDLQAKLAALEQEQYTKNILEKQYQEKIISYTQWQNQLIALAEKELKVKEAQDILLVNRLRLAHFLGI
ncbi:MAG TPA: TolC family protein [Candidatus Glassbacteria bacterium]|nr:TolC family protein [Candidatus Glassbacteria bacterium]